MSELKTLKDIDFDRELKSFNFSGVLAHCCDDRPIEIQIAEIMECERKNILRREAFEWIKEDLKELPENIEPYVSYLINKWIRRFNLTEEDLRGAE